MQIDPKQQEAILHGEGPAIVVAGPGSGKTAVLTRRIAYLIRSRQIPPEKIMVITFTRAAAEEMKSRFLALAGEADAPVFFATFHAAFYRILRREEGLQSGSVLGETQKEIWVRELLQAEHAEEGREADFVGDLVSELSAFKAGGGALDSYQAKCCDTALFRRVFASYEDRLSNSGKVDFDDMLIRTKRLLETKPDVLKLWQKRYPYILVDEFQDINRLQYDTLRLLAGPKRNLFVVGDDDQSIYRFRGAAPEIMGQFVKDYPDAARYELFGCYRCSEAILAPCRRLIDHNKIRFRKELFSLSGRGKPPLIRDFPDRKSEREELIKALQEQRRRGVHYGKMAVLCRTNFAFSGLPSALARAGIPFVSAAPLPDPYSRPEAKDLFAYLELSSGSFSRALFLRAANRPLRYLPRAAFTEDPVNPAKLLASLADKPRQQEAADQLLYQLERLAGMKPYAAVDYVRKKIGYDAWAEENAGSREEAEQILETLDALQEESAAFSDWTSWKKAITKVQKREKAEERRGGNGNRPVGAEEEAPDAVLLSTMHGAKGLEFDAVFLPEVNEGVIPHKSAADKEAIEEERRLLYVAMTRARNYLWLGWVRKTRSGKAEPSRFLRELR